MTYTDADDMLRHLDYLASGLISGLADAVPEPALVFTVLPFAMGKMCYARERTTGTSGLEDAIAMMRIAYNNYVREDGGGSGEEEEDCA